MAAYISALVYDFFRKRSYYNLLLKMTEQMEEKSLLGELLTQPHFLEGQIIITSFAEKIIYQSGNIRCHKDRFGKQNKSSRGFN